MMARFEDREDFRKPKFKLSQIDHRANLEKMHDIRQKLSKISAVINTLPKNQQIIFNQIIEGTTTKELAASLKKPQSEIISTYDSIVDVLKKHQLNMDD